MAITKERFINLEGKSALVVESEMFMDAMLASCLVTQRMAGSSGSHVVPENLSAFMEKNGFDSAVVHMAKNSELPWILEAHKSGKKIVVIRRRNPINQEDVDGFEKLADEKVPTVIKRDDYSIYFTDALRVLSQLFEEDE
jgi:hypothetical protein